jgi:hypothetical protein
MNQIAPTYLIYRERFFSAILDLSFYGNYSFLVQLYIMKIQLKETDMLCSEKLYASCVLAIRLYLDKELTQ